MPTKADNVHESSVKPSNSHETSKFKRIGTDECVHAVEIVKTGKDAHTVFPVRTGDYVEAGDNIATYLYVIAGGGVKTGSNRTPHVNLIAHYDRWAGNNRTSYVGRATGVDGPGPVFIL